jgi:hypothetical protein
MNTWSYCWVLTEVSVSSRPTILYDITQCSPVEVLRRFVGIYLLHHQGWRVSQARRRLEESMNFYRKILCYIPEGSSHSSWRILAGCSDSVTRDKMKLEYFEIPSPRVEDYKLGVMSYLFNGGLYCTAQQAFRCKAVDSLHAKSV